MTESRDVREAGEDLRDTGTVHLESLHRPVARGDGIDKAIGDLILTHVTDDVELRDMLLGDGLVCNPLQLNIELLEEIFKQ